MRINETRIFIFIAALVLGLLISLNINLPGRVFSLPISAQDYQKAYTEKEKLSKEVYSLRETVEKNEAKLYHYQNIDNSPSKVMDDISKELRNNELILGSTEVTGNGVRIIIADNDADLDEDITEEEQTNRIVHDSDILQLMRILKNAGAKAISINGLRVLNNSNFICSGAFIMVDGIKAADPYTIEVIGNSDTMYQYLESEEQYLKYLDMVRNVKVSVAKVDNIKIPAYLVDIKYKYMNEAQ